MFRKRSKNLRVVRAKARGSRFAPPEVTQSLLEEYGSRGVGRYAKEESALTIQRIGHKHRRFLTSLRHGLQQQQRADTQKVSTAAPERENRPSTPIPAHRMTSHQRGTQVKTQF